MVEYFFLCKTFQVISVLTALERFPLDHCFNLVVS